MFTASAITLFRQVMDKPISSSFPLPQLILVSIGLGSMISYVLIRHRVVSKRKSELQISPTTYLFPYIREWPGGHHGAAGHARAGSK